MRDELSGLARLYIGQLEGRPSLERPTTRKSLSQQGHRRVFVTVAQCVRCEVTRRRRRHGRIMWHKVIAMVVTLEVTFLNVCTSEPHGGSSNKWPRPTIISQDYSGFLRGIDQRLRGLDTIMHAVARTEIAAESISNRMELIEARLQTIQSSFQHTLETVTTAVKSSEMKYELLLEQLSRKTEAGFDRLSHRLNSIESRNEAMINKVQNQMELNFGRFETKQNSIGNDLQRVNSNTDAIRTHTLKQEERTNQTFEILVNHFQQVHYEQGVKREHLNNITDFLKSLHTNKSEAPAQNDAPIFKEEGLKIIRTEINDEAHKIGAKLHNMYNDLWRTVKDLEAIMKRGFEETNATSIDLYNRLYDLFDEEQKSSESFMDVVMQSVLSNVGNLLNDLQRQIDNRFKDIKTAQENNGESCQVIKNTIENRVALILERIYDTFVNRTDKFSRHIVEVAEMLKAYNKQVVVSTSETRKFFNDITEGNSEDHKQLFNSIVDVSARCQDLQTITGEKYDLTEENQGTLLEIKTLLLMIYEKTDFGNSTKSLQNGNLHAIEANFTDGVIKIKTNSSTNQSLDPMKVKDAAQLLGIPLEALNKSISTKELVAIMGEPRNDKGNDQEVKKEEEEEEEDDFDTQEEMGANDGNTVDITQFLLAYIKVLHGSLTPSEFLAEAIPGSPFETFDDMITYLQNAGNVPQETIHDIKQLALQEQSDKESLQTDSEITRIMKKLQQNKDIEEEDDYEDED